MTTADPATCPDTNRCHRPDPVPSRVAYHHPLTEYEKQQAELAAEEERCAPRSRFALPPLPQIDENGLAVDGGQPSWVERYTHPTDVVYWVACFGGACLLLLAAIH
jgi:hypothetical protein